MLNLLTEPVIRCDRADGSRVALSLPDVYAALMLDEIVAFAALRPHQRHAWHAFLAQLGVLALQATERRLPPSDADDWRCAIRALTADYAEDEPWRLVVDDRTKPAFLQPPSSSAERAAELDKEMVNTPDALDMLVTSKNHDLKAAMANDGGADDWLFALVSLQTMAGYLGRGNYGISRMNGGSSSRPAFSLAPLGGPGAHVRRDIETLLEGREKLLEQSPRSETGIALVWLQPWDGGKAEALSIEQLAPLYIEICRRVRLVQDESGRLSAWRVGSKKERINAKALNGRTGDPWTPVNVKDGKSLTLGKGGFTYKRIVGYLTDGDWERPLLLQPTRAEEESGEDMQLLARAMVGGQGKTEGYYERAVPFRRAARRALGTRGVEGLGELAQARIEQARIAQNILSYAIRAFVGGGDPAQAGQDAQRYVSPWRDRLDAGVDAGFFDDLQDEFEADVGERGEIRKQWLLSVVGDARALLQEAVRTLPCAAIRRYRAMAYAESQFERDLRKSSGLPFLFEEASDA